jgi:methylenetetrahydrofolate reductase (NADH)
MNNLAESFSRCTLAGSPSISFEFFPPRTPEMECALWGAVERLAPLSPDFVSVTYGAGGTTRGRTHRTVARILCETDLTPAAHLTCVGSSRSEVDAVARRYWDLGVRHVVALRGDPVPTVPGGIAKFVPHPDGYNNAAELVAGLRKVAEFEITVAAHPEIHPDAKSPIADLENLKRKLDAGATRAITQYFFDLDTFLRFRDLAAAAGITAPIVPGILPVTNFATLSRFSKLCGAGVPTWLADLFDGLDDEPETRQLVAATVAAELCHALHLEGVDAFHFYTLNRAALTRAICRMLGVTPSAAQTTGGESAQAGAAAITATV